MKRIRYSKYVPDPAGEMSMEDLLSALSDYLLQSGFQNYMFSDMEGEQTLDDLRRAIEQALLDGNLLDEEMQERLRQMQMDGTLDELIEQLIERMEQEDYISVDQPHDPSQQSSVGGQAGEAQQAKFEITDKSLENPVSADMTRATFRPGSRPVARPGPTNSAIRSTWTLRPRSPVPSSAKA
jgi:Ca-activated chloride channel family protein